MRTGLSGRRTKTGAGAFSVRSYHRLRQIAREKSGIRSLFSPFSSKRTPAAHKRGASVPFLPKMSVSAACKPSSVFGGHLSRPIVAGGFKRNPESSTGRLKRSFVSCSEWGLQRGQVARPRVSSYLTFPPLHARRHAVSLCCTFPGVAPAGCYPALCPMELGLSSHLAARGRPAASQTGGL